MINIITMIVISHILFLQDQTYCQECSGSGFRPNSALCQKQCSSQVVCMAFADALALAQPFCDVSACMQVAMDFSKSQQEDMLHLRRLFYGKLGQLSRARAAMMDLMPAELQHVTDLLSNNTIAHDLADTTDWADQLCANGAEESRAHLYCAVALYGGVS